MALLARLCWLGLFMFINKCKWVDLKQCKLMAAYIAVNGFYGCFGLARFDDYRTVGKSDMFQGDTGRRGFGLEKLTCLNKS